MDYIRKPMLVNAWQFTEKNINKLLPQWVRDEMSLCYIEFSTSLTNPFESKLITNSLIINVRTENGLVVGKLTDFIVQKPNGQLLVYSQKDFEEEYEINTIKKEAPDVAGDMTVSQMIQDMEDVIDQNQRARLFKTKRDVVKIIYNEYVESKRKGVIKK